MSYQKVSSNSLSALPSDNILPQELTNSQRETRRLQIQLPIEILSTNVILASIYAFGLLNYSLTTVAIVETHNNTWKMLYFAVFWAGKAIGGILVIFWRLFSLFSSNIYNTLKRTCLRRKYSKVERELLITREGNVQSASPGPSSIISQSSQSSSDMQSDSSWNILKGVNGQRRLVLILSLAFSTLSNFAFILFRNFAPRTSSIADHIPVYTWWTMVVCRVMLGISHGVNVTVIREHYSRMNGEIQSGIIGEGEVTSTGVDYSKWRLVSLGILSILEFLSFALAPGLGLFHEYLGNMLFPSIFCPAQKFLTHECGIPFFSAFTLMSSILVVIGIVLMTSTCFINTVYYRSTSIKRIMDPKYYKIGWLKIRRYRFIRCIIVFAWICVTVTLTYCGIVFNSLDIFLPWDISELEGLGIGLLLGVPTGSLFICCVVVVAILLIYYLTKKRKPKSLSILSSEFEAGRLLPPQAESIIRSKNILRYKAFAICLMCLLMAGYGIGIMSMYTNSSLSKAILQSIFAGMISAILPMAFTVSWHSFFSSLENFFRKPSRFFLAIFTVIEAIFSLVTVSIMVNHSQYAPSIIFVFGFITLVVGLFCMALIILLSVTNVVGVIVMHHGNGDLKWKDGAITAVKNFKIKTFFMYLYDKQFPLGLDTRNRITIGFPNKSQVEEALLFHRCFQHHNLLRLKGHWINPARKEFHLIYDELNLEKYHFVSLKQYFDESVRTATSGFDSYFRWNHKIDIAVKVVSVLAELHDSFCCHGHLSSWNIFLFISKNEVENKVKKVKMAYLGQGEIPNSSDSPWKKSEISSMTDINDIGVFLLELFVEKPCNESSFFQLLMDDRDCDIPHSAIKECPPDVTDYNHMYRISQWKRIQRLMKECWEPIPKISCRTIIKTLKKARLEKRFEEDDEELIPSSVVF